MRLIQPRERVPTRLLRAFFILRLSYGTPTVLLRYSYGGGFWQVRTILVRRFSALADIKCARTEGPRALELESLRPEAYPALGYR